MNGGPSQREVRERAWLAAAAGLRRWPNFRGKVRFLLALHRRLGLDRRHVRVSAVLHHPVPHRVGLDLFCMHERMAFCMDRYEPGTVEFLARLWPKGEPFFDIGANIGLISIPLLLLRGGERAWCIEAVDENRKGLEANLRLNGLEDRAAVVGAAVGECEKMVDIQIARDLKSGEGTGTANILAAGSTYACERIPLKVVTLDGLVCAGRLPGACGLIKIDTDGYDLFALMGAKALLRDARPVVYGEFHERCLGWHGQSLGDVQAYLEPLGYRVFTRRSGWTFVSPDKPAAFVQDALCVPAEKIDFVRWCLA